MNIGGKLKNLRLSKGLTQEAFAKKFFVKENTISNYENLVRNPSVEFLAQVCKEFGLTLDYFVDKEPIESNPQDLIVTEKHDKKAIFDTKHSCYLTPHIYQNVCISQFGYHLVFNKKNEHITYSAMIDNFGRINEYEGIELGNNGTFDKYGNISAYSIKLNKVVLMNYKGEILSEPYNRIQKINIIQNAPENNFYPLYFGLNVSYNELVVQDLLDAYGNKINLTLDKNSFYEYEVKEFYEFDKLKQFIDKYGIGMIYFIPNSIFKEKNIYIKFLDYIFNKFQTSTKYNFFEELQNSIEIIQLLIDKNKTYQVELERFYKKENLNKILDLIENKIDNKVTINYFKKKIKLLLDKLI